MTAFDRCFTILLGNEGGFTKDPKDRGNWTSGKVGEGVLKGTNWGIAALSYPSLDIEHLTQEQAKAIYKRDFWDNIGLDAVDDEIAFQMFDAAVNHGIRKSIKLAQEALQTTVDGVVGGKTRSLILASSDLEFIIRFNSARLRYYTSISTWNEYGRGWTNRVADNLLRIKI